MASWRWGGLLVSQINGRTLGVRLDEGHTNKRPNADGQGMMGNAGGHAGGMGVGLGMMKDAMSGEVLLSEYNAAVVSSDLLCTADMTCVCADDACCA
jgi:hypothetical protein